VISIYIPPSHAPANAVQGKILHYSAEGPLFRYRTMLKVSVLRSKHCSLSLLVVGFVAGRTVLTCELTTRGELLALCSSYSAHDLCRV
jgi:hypothetical protein